MWQRRTLWCAWGVAFGLAVACMGVVVQGVIRDTRAGDPVIPVDFAAKPHSAEASFRVWGRHTYDLLISSVNHDASIVGRRLAAEFQVEIADPDGHVVLQRTFPPGSTGLELPYDYGDVGLAALELDGSPLRSWTLRVNILESDPDFKSAQTHLKLYKQRYDPGMGGLMNYAMMVPGGVLLLVALALAIALARGGSRVPLLVTGAGGVLILLIL